MKLMHARFMVNATFSKVSIAIPYFLEYGSAQRLLRYIMTIFFTIVGALLPLGLAKIEKNGLYYNIAVS